MAPDSWRESSDFPSDLAEPSSAPSGIVAYSADSEVGQYPNSGAEHNGHRDDAQDLQKSGPVREIVVNGQTSKLQTYGSQITENHPSNFPGFVLPPPCPNLAPPPVPPPSTSLGRRRHLSSIARVVCDCKALGNLCVSKEHVSIFDNLFLEGYLANVAIHTEDGGIIAAHSAVLAAASPVLRVVLENNISWPCRIPMKGVPYDAAKVFVRFLYSSRYEEEEMEEFIVHLLVLSHAYCVPSLKRLCTRHWEQGLLTHENVVDILQMARLCDAPRLLLLCYRVVMGAFKEVARTEGWRVMREANPELEQELVEAVIESDYVRAVAPWSLRKQEKLRKMEDDRVYEQLHDAMEALVHICRDGCRTIGPHDKVFDSAKQGSCNYPACKGIESLVRHFAGCKLKVFGGCVHCKRMWQLLELHSRMCQIAPCKVPLCGHFRNKIGQHQSKRDETRWRLLVNKVLSAKTTSAAFCLAAVSAKLEHVV